MLLLISCAQGGKDRDKPNILLIMADDVSPQLYGCYGNEEAHTPNIDALASSGVAFHTCWAAPICSPTRAMILTGRYAHRTGWYHNALRVPDANGSTDFKKGHLTFAQFLKKQGYVTALSGKWQLPGKPDDPESGFDEYCVWEPGEKNLPEGSQFTGLRENENTLARYWYPSLVRNGELIPTGESDFGPDLCVDFLIDFMKENKEKPFMAYYPMILPHDTRGGRTTTPLSGRVGDHVNGSFREDVDYTDVLVGRLLAALEELGLKENTLVIFTSDNGTPHKNHAINAGARVPMLVDFPGTVRQRGFSDELVSLSDILPTLVDFAGGEVPVGYELDGESLKPYLTGQTDTHREYLFNYLGTARLVRTKEWLLEAVDEVYGMPHGRLYDCREETNKGLEVLDQKDGDAERARAALWEILELYPPLDTNQQEVKDLMPYYDGYQFRHRLE
jgi:arylsulfatase A-like enzyme